MDFCLGVITTVILASFIFLFNTAAHCMSLLVNNVCFYWYYIASGFRSLPLSSLTCRLIVIQAAWWLGSRSSDPKPAAAPHSKFPCCFSAVTQGAAEVNCPLSPAPPLLLIMEPGSREEVKLSGYANALVVMHAPINV